MTNVKQSNVTPGFYPTLIYPPYIKKSSFELYQLTTEFLKNIHQQKVEIDTSAEMSERDAKHTEVILSLTLTSEFEGNRMWQAHCTQAGIYLLEGIEGERRKRLLNDFCFTQLYP